MKPFGFAESSRGRRAGRYESDPYRISVANYCARIVQRHLKVPRTDLLTLPDTPESLARLNEHWNQNVLIMGDLNDHPYDRSVISELRAANGYDKIKELVKLGRHRETPLPERYLRLQPTLFNCMWRFLGIPDEGTYFFDKDVNTMNVLDQFIVSRGLLYGVAGLKIDPCSVDIFKDGMATRQIERPRRFKYSTKQGESEKKATGVSDHFPITMRINMHSGNVDGG